MLNKSHQHSTPTFLQGTTGLYQRRDSPPQVPGTAPKLANPPAAASGPAATSFHAQYYRNKSNPGSSTQLHAVNPNVHQQPFPSFFGDAPRPSASSTSLPLAANNSVLGLNNVGYLPQYTQQTHQQQQGSPQRRLSHTPRGNRTVSTRGELSSHSFSSPRQIQANQFANAAHQQQQQQQQQMLLRQNHLLATSSPHFVQNPQPSSSAGGPKFQRASDAPRRTLTASLRHDSTANSSGALLGDANEPPLPPGWDVDTTPDGFRFFVDHKNRRTTWIHPLAVEQLPAGWTKIFDQVHGVVYYNEHERRSQFDHPGVLNRQQTPRSSVHHPPQRQPSPRHSTAAHSSALAAKIREGARLAAHWDLFKLPQLKSFDSMLRKLYKQEVINTVSKYERARGEINGELLRRFQRS
ncbi:WW domain-containing protein [Aphelenchoides fujianensis]|nr:WW domain-containing protein [Aphelenchoides fujianensis]